MFSYYGSKSKQTAMYPAPIHSRIVEPFAGSARYSLQYYQREVILYDLSPYVIAVWRYLLQASKRDVLRLPNVQSKVSLDSIKSLSEAERYLIGFHLCRGKAKPRKVGHGQNSWNRDKIRIAENLYKIKHWQIREGSYTSIPNYNATYFIDPPYKNRNNVENTDRYPVGLNLDYDHLGRWIERRNGAVIACEGKNADYLPFEPLAITRANTNNSSVKFNMEYVYLQGFE